VVVRVVNRSPKSTTSQCAPDVPSY
jgi:hypothetical protein